VTERYFHEETFSLLGFLAAATQHLKLGLGVTNPYTRHPHCWRWLAPLWTASAVARFLLGSAEATSQ